METHIDRRDFLKSAPAAAALAYGAQPRAAAVAGQKPAPRISAEPYKPVADYPIWAKRFPEVTMKDKLLGAQDQD